MAKERMYCVEFDDLCDSVMTQDDKHMMDFLGEWKDKVPPLKVTLFTIPRRTSAVTIGRLKHLGDWISLAPHGWEHTRGECLTWTKGECVDKIMAAKEMGIDAPVFRAPGWLLDGEVYDACLELGYTVASHEIYRIPGTQVKEYVYNLHFGASPARVKRIHGHLTPVSGNWIYDMNEKGELPRDNKATYLFPWECSKIIPPSVTPSLFVQGGGE